MNRLEKLLARYDELRRKAQAIKEAADASGIDITADDAKELDGILDECQTLQADIDRERRLEATLASTTVPASRRQTEPTRPAEPQNRDVPRVTAPIQTREERAMWGWRNSREYARAVRDAAVGGSVDPRLINAPTTYGSEAVGPDGGFAAPPAVSETIYSAMFAEQSPLGMADSMPTERGQVVVPVDEDPAWGNSSGIRVYSRAEAAAYTQSKPALREWRCDINSVYAFVPLTDELLSDAPMLTNFLEKKSAEKINFYLQDKMINGTGVGEMLGILASPALVTVAAEGSQAADTILQANILKMWARCPAPARSAAVWYMNQDCEPQIFALGQPITNAAGSQVYGGAPMFLPPGGMVTAPSGTLMGRPLVPTEACKTIGDVGDIILAWPKGYGMPYKSGGIKSDVSMHLYFDTGHTAFRWTIRVGGQPWLSTPITRKNGSNTLSHFVALAAR